MRDIDSIIRVQFSAFIIEICSSLGAREKDIMFPFSSIILIKMAILDWLQNILAPFFMAIFIGGVVFNLKNPVWL